MYALNQNIEETIVKNFRELSLKRTYTTLDTNIMRDVVDNILKQPLNIQGELVSSHHHG